MLQINCEQRSGEWFEARRGIPSASNFSKIVTADGGPSKQAKDYLYSLVAERITGTTNDYTSSAMVEGIEREEESRLVYEMQKETIVQRIGFCLHDNRRYGCSPDGLVGEEGLVEFKNPTPHVHVGYLIGGKLPAKYTQQVQGQLLVTGRAWCDFVSYCPGLPTLIVRVERDEEFLAKLGMRLESFCNELEKTYLKIKNMGG